MDTIKDHNQALQQNGYFSAADLACNRQRRYSLTQLQRIEGEGSFSNQKAAIVDQWSSPMLMIALVGMFLFMLAIDPNGHLGVLKRIMGDLFVPVMLVVLILAILFVIVIVPQLFQEPVKRGIRRDTGPIQVLEGQAELHSYPTTPDPSGRRPGRERHILQISGIQIPISERLSQVIQPNLSYRAYIVSKRGTWILLSMEASES